jgi:two-component system chemotaxis response regulator CheB
MQHSPKTLRLEAFRPTDGTKADVIEVELKLGTLLTLHRPGLGLCLLVEGSDPTQIDKALHEALDPFSPNVDVEAKLVGHSSIFELLKGKLRAKAIHLTREVQDPSPDSFLYFYPGTGRLRMGAPLGAQAVSASDTRAKTSSVSKKLRVLVVDDSQTIHRILGRIFETADDIEVVGYIKNPLEVEKAVRELKPDVMTLDIHMPGRNGCEVLESLLPVSPLPVLMLSSLSTEDGSYVFDALELGAVDYIQKPGLGELRHAGEAIIEKLRSASTARVKVRKRRSSRNVAPLPHREPSPASNSEAKAITPVGGGEWSSQYIVAIGASTGGTEALAELFHALPAKIPPIVVVQHIPAVFSAAFAERLNKLLAFEVKEARDGDLVLPNRILIAPGGLQMRIEANSNSQGYKVSVKADPPVNRHAPSVDVLFESVAQLIGAKAMGILLTGMGADGAKGLLEMKNKGSVTAAQDQASSVVFGMPREAIALGAASKVLPLQQIPKALMDWTRSRRA